jgi:phage tail protein X
MASYLEHRTRTGDRLDLLAWTYYGNPYEWPRIMEANPTAALAGLRQPVLAAGLVLKIPLVAQDDLLIQPAFEFWA